MSRRTTKNCKASQPTICRISADVPERPLRSEGSPLKSSSSPSFSEKVATCGQKSDATLDCVHALSPAPQKRSVKCAGCQPLAPTRCEENNREPLAFERQSPVVLQPAIELQWCIADVMHTTINNQLAAIEVSKCDN
eukprot:5779360-Amphidinium_carterae.1